VGVGATADRSIALIEARPFVRECIRRSMHAALSLPVVTYSTASELEGATSAKLVVLSLMDSHCDHRRGVEAIKAAFPLGSAAYEPEVTKGLRQIWVEPAVVGNLKAMRPVCSASKARASTLPKDHRRRSSKGCCAK
jgi:hypothetical protein